MRRVAQPILLGLFCLMLCPCAARAQSAIAGTVRDSSGAVLPGVIVEASSPALIERSRSVVTDSGGQYKIVDLRPGTYDVMFTLPGFGGVKREGIELPASFTATVNAELRVGAVEETLTVTGEAPIVDVQSSVQQSVISRSVLDAVPTGRNVFAVGALIAGTSTTRPDVGGSEGMQQNSYVVHGSETRDIAFQVDGMSVNSNYQDGSFVGVYYNDGMMQDISYQTNALPAEVSQGGLRINMIPREGGNSFRGAVFGTGASGRLQSDNYDAALAARGLKVPNSIDNIYDVNLSLGGPIQHDRLWFFTTFRRWGVNRFVADTFNPDGSQALDDSHITSGVLRLTAQITSRNKVSAYYDKNVKFRGHRRAGGSFISPEAALYQTTPLGYTSQAKWTSTSSDRLLFESGVSLFFLHYTTGYQPGIGPADLSRLDFVTSTLTGAAPYDYDSYATRRTYTAATTYVTGAHALKAGVQVGEGPYRETYVVNGDLQLRFRDGSPDSVDVFNTPVDVRERLNADLGLYLQDSWTRQRMTINAGARFEHFNTSVQAQQAGAGRFVPARTFPETRNTPNWNNAVPRLGIVYDLFGNGRTALRASASKYLESEGVGLADRVNPMYLASDRRSWTDRNSDRTAQFDEIGPSTGFTGGSGLRIDPGITRPYNWEYSAGIQQQVASGFSLSTAYYRRNIRNIYGTKNLLVPPAAYSPVTITDPLTNAPLTVYNQDVATRGLTDLFVSNYPELDRTYNGVEFKADKRFGRGATLFGGFTIGHKLGSIRGTTSDLNNLNVLINSYGYADLDATYQFRLAGSYPLPLGIQFSGRLALDTGQPSQRVYTITRTVVPNLTQVSIPVDLVERGSVRLDRINQLDVRIAKRLPVGKVRLDAIGDIFNVFNSSGVTAEVTAVGPSLRRPTAIVDGRLLRLGFKLDF